MRSYVSKKAFHIVWAFDWLSISPLASPTLRSVIFTA